jgi:hypothetical protein
MVDVVGASAEEVSLGDGAKAWCYMIYYINLDRRDKQCLYKFFIYINNFLSTRKRKGYEYIQTNGLLFLKCGSNINYIPFKVRMQYLS